MLMKQVMRALMIVRGQMRQPVLHDPRIAQPAPLNVAQPAAEAGGGGKQQQGFRKAHRPFGDQHAHEHKQTIPR